MRDLSECSKDLQIVRLDALSGLTPSIERGQPVTIVASDMEPAARALLEARFFTASERRRADRFRLAQNQREHLLGRSLLRRVLGDLLKLPPTAVPIEPDERGKPSVPGQDFHFNVTHSNGWVAAAFCKGRRIGVDIEATGRIDAKEAAQLSRMVLSPAEQHLFAAASAKSRTELFLRLWRLKEAVLKAEGCGLIDDLPSLDLAHLVLRASGDVKFGGANWSICEKKVTTLPPLAVAVEH